MVTCSIYGRETKLQGSPLTLVIYNQEFSSDLMQDIVEAYKDGNIHPAYLLKIAWSMAKTAEPTLPHFEEWMNEFDDSKFNLLDTQAWGVIDSAISAELFCGKTSTKRRKSNGEK